jgi:EmrB/QacA subfamily drug resistance transporter
MQMQQTKPVVGQDTGYSLTLPNGKAVNAWLVLLSIIFGFFMSLLDATVVNIAITDIQQSLNSDLTTVSWVFNAYNLVFAVLLVTMGRFADQFGRKGLFMLGMVLFSIGSLLCAIAPSIEWLIFFRGLQAIGAAALNSVSLAIITYVFPPQKRGAAIAIWGALAGLAAALGPVLGGFLVDFLDWRWIFYVNLPFCVIGLVMVAVNVPENRDPNAGKSIDVLGLLTLTTGLVCAVLAIIEGNNWGWTSGITLTLFAVSLVSLGLFYVVETRQKQPIFDFKLFSIRSFSTANVAMFMFSVAIQGAFLILVLYFINVQGYNELNAAYALLPMPLASFVVSGISSKLAGKLNPRFMGIAGMIFVTLGLLSLTTLGYSAGYFDTAWRAVIIGIGMGFCFITFPNITVSEVPRPRLGVASGVLNTFRQVGFALGVAILISIFTGQISTNVTQARDRAIAIVQADTVLPEQVKSSIVAGLQSAASAGAEQGGNTTFDLTAMADRIPNGETLKPTLATLNGRIAEEFKRGAVDAFTFTWWVAGIIALVGIGAAFFAAPSRKEVNAPVVSYAQ